MEPSSAESTPKRYSRGHGSPGRAVPRRSTRGALDISESPIHTPSPLTSPPMLAQQSSLLSPTSVSYTTPRLPSPQIGSNLSSLASGGTPSFRTAQTSLSPSHSNFTNIQKDFSFLLRPEIYHPITLLDVPPPFRTTTSQPPSDAPLPLLISTGNFRSAAIKAASILTSTGISPSDYATIFELVYTRLSCLTLCNQTPLAAQEVKALEDLNSIYYRDESTGHHLVPWELRVLAVRLQGMGFNDARRGVMGYFDLAREARLSLTSLKKARKMEETPEGKETKGEEIRMWEVKLRELGIRVASALVEMEDLEGASRFLATLEPAPPLPEGLKLEIQKALLWLCLGDVEAARTCVAQSGDTGEHEKKVILALAYMADAEFGEAVRIWEELVGGEGEEAEAAMWKQNLGVCLLYLGRMDEARAILETLIETHHSFHALTFNLSTVYELCTERSRAMKISLAEKVAEMQEEDGKKDGWEKVNGDFKL